MLIYNITIQVDWRVHDKWLLWLQEIYLPYTMHHGGFKKHQLVKLLQVDDAEGPTYALQLHAESMAIYNRYIQLYLPEIEKQTAEAWGNNVLSFSTLMEVVDL